MAQDEKNFVSQLTVKTTKHAFNDSSKRRQNLNFWNLLSPELKRRWNYPKSVSCHAGPALRAHSVWIAERIGTCTQNESLEYYVFVRQKLHWNMKLWKKIWNVHPPHLLQGLREFSLVDRSRPFHKYYNLFVKCIWCDGNNRLCWEEISNVVIVFVVVLLVDFYRTRVRSLGMLVSN